MRKVDWDMAIAVRDHWQGRGSPRSDLCPLLADVDALLKHLDEIGLTPGDVIDPCPSCGQEHRWTLLKELMCLALKLQPARQSKLLAAVDQSLESVRALYGGKEKYEAMEQEAEKFFARVGAGNLYKP